MPAFTIARRLRRPVGSSCIALLVGVGCGGGNSGGPDFVADQPLSGQISVGKWTYVMGQASLQSGLSFVTLYSASFTPCSGTTPDTDTIVIDGLAPAVGTYHIGVTPNLSASFSGSDDLDATTGVVVVTAITATTLTGGANIAAADPRVAVDGRFQATICP